MFLMNVDFYVLSYIFVLASNIFLCKLEKEMKMSKEKIRCQHEVTSILVYHNHILQWKK